MRKEAGLLWYHSIGLAFSCSRGNFHTNCCRPHPVRGIKLLREPCFYHLQTINSSRKLVKIFQIQSLQSRNSLKITSSMVVRFLF